MNRIIKVFLLGFLLSGCAATFQTLEPSYNFGAPPTDYEEKIKKSMRFKLKDPDSAIFDFESSRPIKAYTNAGLAAGGEVSWAGWVVYYKVNAKNSYGAYTGFETEKAFFTNNEIHRWKYPNSPYANFTLVP